MLKSLKLLAKELDNSKNIMYASIVDNYMHHRTHLDSLSLVEYATFSLDIQKREKGHLSYAM